MVSQQLSFDIDHTPRQECFANPEYLEFIEEDLDEDYLEYIADRENLPNSSKKILSLFDHSGNWSQPYRNAGYDVITCDLKTGQDVNDFSVEYLTDELELYDIYGVLAGVPCTDFATSGARWFKNKDQDGRTDFSIEMVKQTLRTITLFNPHFWVIENPVGRMPSLVPELNSKPWYFNPCDFGRDYDDEDYTKKTGLWGKFVPPSVLNVGEDRSVHPAQGSKMHKLYGGNSEHTKTMRSITPRGFAQAFYDCNR